MELAAVLVAWVLALATSTGMAFAVSRGMSGTDTAVPRLSAVPIAAPVVALVAAGIELSYVVRNGTSEIPYAGLAYPVVWGVAAGCVWLLAALLTRKKATR